MASSSQSHPPSDPCWKYDVFLSFRGPDTRKGITIDIYNRLTSAGIKTFMDDRVLEVGDVISPALVAAIRESRFAVVVLSQNYASSTWCLDELSEICLSMKDKRIMPLFYQVNPTDVRHQKQSFKEALTKHEESGRHKSDKLKQWKFDLNRVAKIIGWNTDNYKTHKDLIDVIVEYFRSKVVPEAIDSTEDFQVFEATRKAIDEILEALKDNEVTAVGVYGMGGVGKSTLMKHVGAQTRKSGIFDVVTTVVVSQHPNSEKLQDTMAEQLGFKFDEKTEIGRAAKLHKETMRKTKILIILDDIWERIEFSRFGIPSYKELQKCKSKVLVTTRIRNVCHAMECQTQITLNVLSEDDSWDLFERKAGRSLKSSSFEGEAKKVVKECKGLPVALVTVARALGDKDDLEEWTRAAERLEKSQLANPDDNRDVFRCIKLGYDYLKDQNYKSYFLLCSLFPEDYDIPIEELFRYAIGKGLFRDDETLNEARNNAGSLATHLKHSCLLLESAYGRRYVRMHDVVRDAAIQIARFEDGHGFLVRAACGLVDWPRQLHEGYSAVSLMRNAISKLPEMLVWPKLQILLLNNNPFTEETTKTFFRSPNELRVLDLSWTKFSLVSLGLLTNLQALYLDGRNINDTSILGELKKLEILSMRNSSVTELSMKIGELTNLRMLDNTGGVVSRIPSKVISKLHNLEEMYMQGFVEWRNTVEVKGEETDAACLDEVTGLSKLRVLNVCFSAAKCIPKYVEFIANWVVFDIFIGIYDHREMLRALEFSDGRNSLCLKTDTISGLPDWFCNKVLNAAESLCWKEGRRLIDIFVESEIGRLTGLKQLLVEGPEKVMKLTNTMSWVPKKPVFENLEVLRLFKVDCRELFAVESLPLGSLFNLKVLNILGHYDLESMRLPSTLLQRLVNLEELALSCESMEGSEYVFGYEEALLVSKLYKLRNIELCDRVAVSICDGPAPAAMFQNLQSLTITWCHDLQGSLFSYDVAQCLTQLNCLVVEHCPLLERIVESRNKKIILPKLKHLSLKKLSKLYYESATFDIECPSLEYLELSDCPKFKAFSSDFHSRKQVQLGRWRPH